MGRYAIYQSESWSTLYKWLINLDLNFVPESVLI